MYIYIYGTVLDSAKICRSHRPIVTRTAIEKRELHCTRRIRDCKTFRRTHTAYTLGHSTKCVKDISTMMVWKNRTVRPTGLHTRKPRNNWTTLLYAGEPFVYFPLSAAYMRRIYCRPAHSPTSMQINKMRHNIMHTIAIQHNIASGFFFFLQRLGMWYAQKEFDMVKSDAHCSSNTHEGSTRGEVSCVANSKTLS